MRERSKSIRNPIDRWKVVELSDYPRLHRLVFSLSFLSIHEFTRILVTARILPLNSNIHEVVKEGRGCSFSEIVSQIIPRGGTKECGWGGLRITIVGDCHASVARSSGPGNSVMYNSRLHHRRHHHHHRGRLFLKVALAGRNEPFVPR